MIGAPFPVSVAFASPALLLIPILVVSSLGSASEVSR